MKKIFILLLTLILCLTFVACSSETTETTADSTVTDSSTDTDTTAAKVDGSSIVIYFSQTGNTEAIAEKIAEEGKFDICELKAKTPYTDDDIDYNVDDCRANSEQNDDNARPEIEELSADISEYSTIYLGYPIWWGKVPKVILTFLESADLEGKTIVPFCTSGSSDISGSLPEIKAATSATVTEGLRFANDADTQTIQQFIADNS